MFLSETIVAISPTPARIELSRTVISEMDKGRQKPNMALRNACFIIAGRGKATRARAHVSQSQKVS